MKNKTIALLSIVAIALLAGCSPQDESKTVADLEKETAELREPISQPKTESDETPVDFKLLVARDGKQYIGDSDLPFSGIAVAWHENGQKKVEGTFKDGLGNGGFRDFHPNGQKWIEGTYKDGKREGIWSKWDEDGKKTMQSTFKDGVVIAERFLTPVDVNLLNKQNDIWFKVNSEIPFRPNSFPLSILVSSFYPFLAIRMEITKTPITQPVLECSFHLFLAILMPSNSNT